MAFWRVLLSAILLALSGFFVQSKGAIIASTNFNGRTVSGATASNLTWTVNGVADPGALTASHDLFNTANAQDLYAVNRNINNEGPWTVDVALNVGSSALLLSTVTLDAYIFNNSGNFQTLNRDLDLKVELLHGGVVDSDSVNNIYPENANSISPAQPRQVSFDLSGNTLTSNTNYILRITASNDATLGNNAGFDNLVINGSVISGAAVPEPATLTLWSLGALGCASAGYRRRKTV